MGARLLSLLAGAGRRLRLWAALALAVAIALWLALHQGRRQARATFALRAAEARTRALRISREVSHELDTLPRAERDRRLRRWMRD
jgi:uncharacterized protein YndB with AHSA1/START domain